MIEFLKTMFNKPTVLWNFWEELVFMFLCLIVIGIVIFGWYLIAIIKDKRKKRK